MELTVNRKISDDKSVEGDFLIVDKYFCESLELPWGNGANQHGINCILPGRYSVTIDFSPHHQRLWPHILNVPNRDEIRIDVANFPTQIKGCVAVGFTKGVDFIGQSQIAWNQLFNVIQTALTKEQVWITFANKF